MARIHLLATLLVIYLALSVAPTWAQSNPATANPATGTVSGRILDSLDGPPAKNTRIVILDEKSGQLYNTQQNAKGEFSITLPEGFYVVLITKLGFKPFAKEIDLERDKPVKLTVTLDPGGEWETYVTGC